MYILKNKFYSYKFYSYKFKVKPHKIINYIFILLDLIIIFKSHINIK